MKKFNPYIFVFFIMVLLCNEHEASAQTPMSAIDFDKYMQLVLYINEKDPIEFSGSGPTNLPEIPIAYAPAKVDFVVHDSTSRIMFKAEGLLHTQYFFGVQNVSSGSYFLNGADCYNFKIDCDTNWDIKITPMELSDKSVFEGQGTFVSGLVLLDGTTRVLVEAALIGTDSSNIRVEKCLQNPETRKFSEEALITEQLNKETPVLMREFTVCAPNVRLCFFALTGEASVSWRVTLSKQ